MKINKIIHANVVTPYRVIEDAEVCIENGIITYVGKMREDDSEREGVLDAKHQYLSSGFIDLHTHGAGGHDFMDGTEEAFLEAAIVHAKHGTTLLLPTTLACSNEELENVVKVFHQAKGKSKGAILYGLHLEGPYFSQNQRGAQDEKYIKAPDPVEYEALLNSTTDIVRWTAAPELERISEFACALRKHGILASIGHSDAVLEDVQQAFENGFTHITHLYSGMSAMVRKNSFRYPGVTESAYMIDEMTVEIIADGKHLPASILKYVYQTKGADKICLVTDSMRGAGMPDGKSILGSLKAGQEVVIEDGVAKLFDRSAFAGSVATADRVVRNMIQLADVPLCDAVRMMTATPARIAKIKNKGIVALGYDADFTLYDSEINIKATVVNGELIYRKQYEFV
ncbi:N-acetylglucosamine-6-phosphate deacetylase [Paludicola sp. MB14-C6]|uniref:N-acetylglucosamine-6-phosphate deacetylase n=1 Tax=Paludihabitans sp. MB14-C6 TaxID=3070656 RepID=UPI0027DAD080|nr:N-acetylglucosamine-6-phosphate deacetylase [Paludicola sp. MB14-C6]WMJ23263.1 N-acetylglucosamine-6-phosphate deacetylase [Paludicola sp. MB14-C6]